MADPEMQGGPTYRQVLEANNAIQTIGDDTYWLCVTRTVQESKLFPVPAYMLLSYLMCFYRYPALLRKIEERMPAEELGDRSRIAGGKFGSLAGWGLPCFYLLGREILINFGLLAPDDAADDVVYVMDFWRRFKLAQARDDGHLNAREGGQRVQVLPDHRLQVLHADLKRCAAGDPLHRAAHGFLAAVSQYGFLVSCESRVTLNNSGPYRLGDDRELIVREFNDLAQGDFPWLDGVADDMPYNNLTVTMEVAGCHFYLVDDWGSFESRPEFTADKLVGVGLYTSDILSEGWEPVGMSSPEELTHTFEDLTARCKAATVALWKRMSGWTRDQMMDAGAIVYFSIIKDLAHAAGVYEVDDWMQVDERAARFRPLLNDEFGRDFLGELVGLIDLPSQQLSPYAMMPHNDRPVRYLSHLPARCPPGRLGPIAAGASAHMPKVDRYMTTRGPLPLAEFNMAAQAFTPAAMATGLRDLSDAWLRWHPDDPAAAEVARLARRFAPALAEQPADLGHAAIEALRRG